MRNPHDSYSTGLSDCTITSCISWCRSTKNPMECFCFVWKKGGEREGVCEVLYTRIRNPKATNIQNSFQAALSCQQLSQITPSIRPSQEFLEGNIWIMNVFMLGNTRTAPLGALKRCPEETPYCVKGAINAWNMRAEAPWDAGWRWPSRHWWPFPTSYSLGAPEPQVRVSVWVGTSCIEPPVC